MKHWRTPWPVTPKGSATSPPKTSSPCLRALPETDGTYGEVINRAREYGADVSQHTLGKWVSTGRTDLKAGKRQTAFARFAQRYDQLMEEHCNSNANRNRELDRALEILERTCDCGNEKTVMSDGKLADQCRGVPGHRRHRPPVPPGRLRPPRAPLPRGNRPHAGADQSAPQCSKGPDGIQTVTTRQRRWACRQGGHDEPRRQPPETTRPYMDGTR